MSQVVACAQRSNFRFPSDLNSLIYQSSASRGLNRAHTLMSKEWVECFMPNIEGSSSEKPTPEPLIPMLGIVCEVRRDPEVNGIVMRVQHTH